MNYRIEISPLPQWRDARGEGVKKQIEKFFGFPVEKVWTRDIYTIAADITEKEAQKVAELLYNPVLQGWRVTAAKSENFQELPECEYLVAVGFRPGVTDNVGRSAKSAVGDILGRKLGEDEAVFSSTEYLFYGSKLTREQAGTIASKLLANELIQTVRVLSGEEVADGIPMNLPFVTAVNDVKVREYDLEVSDDELMEISRKGILALSLDEMKAIQNYFRKAENRAEYGLGKNPTDVELEVIAQTWSEHCKHKIFAAKVDYTDEETGEKQEITSCYKTFIQKSTKEIGEKVDFLVSVFKDNAGVIKFNDKVDLVYKVETHNSPSALDPYGGAMTGIVGVNRDPLGTGQGADLLINVWGYCLGSPFTDDKDVPEGLLHPRRLRDGVHKGVIDGGNQSGIPYGNGFEYFDARYIGKPLVYCGTVGTLPKTVNGVPAGPRRSSRATSSSWAADASARTASTARPSQARSCIRTVPCRPCRSVTRSPRRSSAISSAKRATAGSTALSPTTARAAFRPASARWPSIATAAAWILRRRRSSTPGFSRGRFWFRRRRSA